MSELTDHLTAKRITEFLQANPHACRHDIRKKLGISSQRMNHLHKIGLCVIPPPMNPSIAATLNRKRNNIGKGWYINKPAPWDMK